MFERLRGTIQHKLLDAEQKIGHKMGRTMGWANSTQNDITLFKAVAEEMRNQGKGEIEVTQFTLLIKGEKHPNAVKMVTNEKHGLLYFWRAVDETRNGLGGWVKAYNAEQEDVRKVAIESVKKVFEKGYTSRTF